MRNLVVLAEDNEDLGDIVKAKLEHADLRVIWKKNGEEAWDAIKAEKPALTILDLDLPGVDGLEILRRIRASPELEKVRVMMLSAMGYDAYVGGALQGGAVDFVVKPFNTADLLTRVQSALQDK